MVFQFLMVLKSFERIKIVLFPSHFAISSIEFDAFDEKKRIYLAWPKRLCLEKKRERERGEGVEERNSQKKISCQEKLD